MLLKIKTTISGLMFTFVWLYACIVYGQDVKSITLITSVTNPIFNDLTNVVFDRLGIKYELIKVPWPQALQRLKDGDADAIPFMFYTEKRAKYAEYSDPVFDTDLSFYVAADSRIEMQSITYDALMPYKVGFIKDYAYCKGLVDAVSDLKIDAHFKDNIELGFIALGNGDIDIFVIQEIFAGSEFDAGQINKQDFRRVSSNICVQPLHIAFSKKSPAREMIPELNEIISEIKEDGTLKRILSNE